MDRYLFGKLNNEIKQREYKGLPTETTETIVDNADNTIKVEIKNPITIEDNCWIASNVIVCGGVTIGEGSVIGAGSVVLKDIPKNSFAAGNPCRVIREITEEDRVNIKKLVKD